MRIQRTEGGVRGCRAHDSRGDRTGGVLKSWPRLGGGRSEGLDVSLRFGRTEVRKGMSWGKDHGWVKGAHMLDETSFKLQAPFPSLKRGGRACSGGRKGKKERV